MLDTPAYAVGVERGRAEIPGRAGGTCRVRLDIRVLADACHWAVFGPSEQPARWDQAEGTHKVRSDAPGGAVVAGDPPSRCTPFDPGGDGLLRERAPTKTETIHR
jgi:hypothetical protein